MKQLAACAVARGPRRGPKLAKLACEIGRVLIDEVGPECMQMIEQSDGRVKLIANAPLELLPIRDLPMQLRYTVSRVPVTPANVFLSHTIGDPGVYISPSDLSDVLIVRSFDEDDPIKHALEKASKAYLDAASRKLNIRLVDVASPDEFAQAVNSFTGKILVFDGHGTHREKDETGLLEVGGELIDPTSLAGEIERMPPIVILSACSTHPLDWSETSSAGAFLTMGAMSVLGTVTPILARDAAVFVGRLLLRLAEFVPLIAASGQRWNDVISGLLRMSYVTDLIRAFEAEKLISADDHRQIQFEANTLINSGNDEWFERALTALSNASGWSVGQVRSFWLDNAYFTSAMRYVHLGGPERIVIVGDDGEDDAWKREPSNVRGLEERPGSTPS
jgi:hypothetical protein